MILQNILSADVTNSVYKTQCAFLKRNNNKIVKNSVAYGPENLKW